MAEVVFSGVSKSFDQQKSQAVDHLSLEVEDGELLVLLGPSGCGKTTALRMVAGLTSVDEGTISIGTKVVNDIEPKDRDVAMVFQSYALYPHLTVARNIEFPLRQRGMGPDERKLKVQDAAKRLGLLTLLDRKPAALSGGQRQRVALARAIVREPQVFLMDEPLSNLDAALRGQTRADIVAMHARLGTTMLYVTHDQVEAMTMGHRIAILKDGVLQQLAPPQVAYDRPANTCVAGFLGTPPMNFLEGRLLSASQRSGTSDVIEVSGGSVFLSRALSPLERSAIEGDGKVTIGIRPESLVLDAAGSLSAKVLIVESLGPEVLVITQVSNGSTLTFRQSTDRPRPILGENVTMRVQENAVHLFDHSTGDRIEESKGETR